MLTPCALGILAHVDAGKTTLSEQLLYRTGAIRSPGRVDHGDTALDTDPIERTRGITVFSGQAWFELGNRRYTLIDTPGHVDFSAEAERSLTALDMAILLIDGGAGVKAHTTNLFRLAAEYRVPTLLFINKTDLPSYDKARVLAQISTRLTNRVVSLADGAPDMEQLSMLDDAFCERYLTGEASENDAWAVLERLCRRREAFALLDGAALSGKGVDALLNAISRLCRFAPPASDELDALIYKVHHEPNGDRVCFLRMRGGVLRPRDAIRCGDAAEKIHQLRLYRGDSFTPVDEARAGDTIGVTGLSTPRCGSRLLRGELTRIDARFQTQPVLAVRVEPPQGVSPSLLLEKLRLLEDEDPALSVSWDEAHGAALVRVMGTVQTEVLTQLMENRFGLRVHFLPPLVLYKETLAAPVVGCGHYEPLRHYAEAHLLLSPGPRGSGVTFRSRCHVDDLALSFQNLIRMHVFERTHRGVLTGSPLTDLQVTLLAGRAHLKHTEGGDFREAVCRAIRQGLMKGQSALLEPFYRFAFTVPADCLGRVMTDMAALFAVCDAPEAAGGEARVTGRGPVSTLMNYPTQLRAITHGRGEFQLQPDGYDLCHNPDEVISSLAYSCGADTQNPTGSVFCSHGAGYFVPWDEADAHMHLPVERPD